LDSVVAPPAWQVRPARGLAEAPDQPVVAVEVRLQAACPRHHQEVPAVEATALAVEAVASAMEAVASAMGVAALAVEATALAMAEPVSLSVAWVG